MSFDEEAAIVTTCLTYGDTEARDVVRTHPRARSAVFNAPRCEWDLDSLGGGKWEVGKRVGPPTPTRVGLGAPGGHREKPGTWPQGRWAAEPLGRALRSRRGN